MFHKHFQMMFTYPNKRKIDVPVNLSSKAIMYYIYTTLMDNSVEQ